VAWSAGGTVALAGGAEPIRQGPRQRWVISKVPRSLPSGLSDVGVGSRSLNLSKPLRTYPRTSDKYSVYPHVKVPERMFSNSGLAIQVANHPDNARQVDSKSTCKQPGQFTQCARELLQAGLQMETAYKVRARKAQGGLQVCTGDLGRCQLNLQEATRPTTITVKDEGSTVIVIVGIVAGVVGLASGIAIGYGLPKK